MATWWMMAYGHPTPKRQQARSNWSGISALDAGKLAASAMRAKTKFATTSHDFMKCMHAAQYEVPIIPLFVAGCKVAKERLGQETSILKALGTLDDFLYLSYMHVFESLQRRTMHDKL